jgi:aminoglycoside phosphotransferase (APT) family kinase protein
VVQHWEAEAVVDEERAQALVRAQFPEVAADSVELVAAGWDYTVHRVDGDWAFRFPRRAVVLEPMQREIRVLPQLAPLLPVAVPEPVHLGRPSDTFPWPFYGARWLDGHEASLAEERIELARPLARAIRAIHDADVPGLPLDVVSRADMNVRVPRTRDELAAVEAEGLWSAPAAVGDLLGRAARLEPVAVTTVCHCDLHFRQVLVDGSRVTGIVDWVDVCRSDPGIDLQLAFAYLPLEARPVFFDEYGPVGEESLLRARVLALNLSAVLARYGRAQGLERVEREAVASLDRAVADF